MRTTDDKQPQGSAGQPVNDRVGGSVARALRFGPFVFHTAGNRLSRDGVELHLTPKAAAVLRFLLQRPGELIGKDEFLETVWEGVFVREESLTQAISVIRQALGDSAQSPRYIQTVSGEGYRFIGSITTRGAEPRRRVDKSGVERRAGHWRVAAAIVAIILVGAILTLAWPSGSTPDGDAPIRSLAILPLEHLGDSEHRHLTEFMTDLLSARLGRVGELTVIPPDPARRAIPAEASYASIATDLNVDALVSGSVLWDAETLRVVVHLVDGGNGAQIRAWDDERGLRDALLLPRDLTRSIVDALSLPLPADDERRLASPVRPVSMEAFDHVAAGWGIATGRLGVGLDKAIGHFSEAIAIDPEYADAHAGLAATYVQLGTYGLLPPEDAFPRAREAAEQAIALDGAGGGPHIANAWVHFVYEQDFERAAAEFARGIELAPNDYGGYHQHAWFQMALGRFDDAAASMEKARLANPYSRVSHAQSAAPHYFQHEYDRALEHAQRASDFDPNFGNAYVQLGRIYLATRETDQAIEAFLRADELTPHPRLLGDLALAYGAAGRGSDAEAMLDELEAIARTSHVEPLAFAWAHLGVGDHEQALRWLTTAVDQSSNPLPLLIEWDPKYDPLRGDARFAELVARVRRLRDGAVGR